VIEFNQGAAQMSLGEDTVSLDGGHDW